jgi:hypothetical protein
MARATLARRPPTAFGKALSVEQLTGLAAELVTLRTHPPLVKRQDGRYEGDILGFVRGLRLSARVIYFLRERLSTTGLEINWGHVVKDEQSCSPECDIIIHTAGHVRKWNGNAAPVMDFKFVDASSVRAVVSCKSTLDHIDKDYPKALKKYGVKKIFLFAEVCRASQLKSLRSAAKKAGYSGLWSLCLVEKPEAGFTTDERMYVDFGETLLKAVKA